MLLRLASNLVCSLGTTDTSPRWVYATLETEPKGFRHTRLVLSHHAQPLLPFFKRNVFKMNFRTMRNSPGRCHQAGGLTP